MRVGELPGEYCPGGHGINVGGHTKVAGIAQRTIRGAALTTAVLVVGGGDDLRRAVAAIYAALGRDADPAVAGALDDARAGITVGGAPRESCARTRQTLKVGSTPVSRPRRTPCAPRIPSANAKQSDERPVRQRSAGAGRSSRVTAETPPSPPPVQTLPMISPLSRTLRGALLALALMALGPVTAAIAAPAPALKVPAAPSVFAAAGALGAAHWQREACGGQVAITWEHLGSRTNAQSRWSAAGRRPDAYCAARSPSASTPAGTGRSSAPSPSTSWATSTATATLTTSDLMSPYYFEATPDAGEAPMPGAPARSKARAGTRRAPARGETSHDRVGAHCASARSPSGMPSGVGTSGVSRRYHSASSAAWQPEPAAVIAWR